MLTSISAPQITSTAPKVKVPPRRSRAGRDSGVCSGLFITVGLLSLRGVSRSGAV